MQSRVPPAPSLLSVTGHRMSVGKLRSPQALDKSPCAPTLISGVHNNSGSACPRGKLTDHPQVSDEHQRNSDWETNDIVPDGINDGSDLLVPTSSQNATTCTLWADNSHQCQQY